MLVMVLTNVSGEFINRDLGRFVLYPWFMDVEHVWAIINGIYIYGYVHGIINPWMGL